MVSRRILLGLLLVVALGGCQRRSDPNIEAARACLETGDLDRGIQYLDEALRGSPNSAEARLLRGKALLEKGAVNEAIVDLERTVALGMTLEGNRHLSQAYFTAGEFKKTQSAADAWIELEPSASALLLRGRARLAQSDPRGALNDLQRAEQLDARLHQAPLYQGVAHLQLEELEPAESCLTRSIAAQSNNPYGFWIRAITREKLGKTAAAEADRSTAKELDPALRFTKSDGEGFLRSAIERDSDLLPIERLNSIR
jgi:tetratricopeptide (TPR) repeat protein